MATPIADMVEKMLSTGIPPETIVLAIRTAEEAAHAAQPIADQMAEKRRAWDRERKRNAKQSNFPPEFHNALSLPSTATTSTVVKEERSESVALGREFAETFYPVYPHHVGRPKAEIAFRKARKRASLETIMAGLERYRAKTDDRPWCNPATWLNQDRWDDKPGPTQEGNGNGRGRPAPKDDPKSIRGAFDRIFERLENGDLPRETNLRIVPGRSG